MSCLQFSCVTVASSIDLVSALCRLCALPCIRRRDSILVCTVNRCSEHNCRILISRIRFARLCVKVENKFNIIRLSGTLGDQKSCTWTLKSTLVY
jgi:hypothetical protein